MISILFSKRAMRDLLVSGGLCVALSSPVASQVQSTEKVEHGPAVLDHPVEGCSYPALVAYLARVSVVTIRNFENQKSTPQRATLDVIQRAFEAAGVEFTNGDRPGVRLVGPVETPASPKPAATRRAKTSKRKE